ncbi:hypothetical protein AB1Y20_012497 [Prymnesium parvum]|uniref:Apple domain-containing protein n=1 Tax=Prymnesium parvum TaxID=97485 RepID=A0AB34IKQ0_PRYPA
MAMLLTLGVASSAAPTQIAGQQLASLDECGSLFMKASRCVDAPQCSFLDSPRGSSFLQQFHHFRHATVGAQCASSQQLSLAEFNSIPGVACGSQELLSIECGSHLLTTSIDACKATCSLHRDCKAFVHVAPGVSPSAAGLGEAANIGSGGSCFFFGKGVSSSLEAAGHTCYVRQPPKRIALVEQPPVEPVKQVLHVQPAVVRTKPQPALLPVLALSGHTRSAECRNAALAVSKECGGVSTVSTARSAEWATTGQCAACTSVRHQYREQFADCMEVRLDKVGHSVSHMLSLLDIEATAACTSPPSPPSPPPLPPSPPPPPPSPSPSPPPPPPDALVLLDAADKPRLALVSALSGVQGLPFNAVMGKPFKLKISLSQPPLTDTIVRVTVSTAKALRMVAAQEQQQEQYNQAVANATARAAATQAAQASGTGGSVEGVDEETIASIEATQTSLLASSTAVAADSWQEQPQTALAPTQRLHKLASAALTQLRTTCVAAEAHTSVEKSACAFVELLSGDDLTLSAARAYVDASGVYYKLDASVLLAERGKRTLHLSLFEQPAQRLISLLQAELLSADPASASEGPLLSAPLAVRATLPHPSAAIENLSTEEAQQYGASPPPPPPPPLAFVESDVSVPLNCTIVRVDQVGGVRVQDVVERSAGTLSSGYADQVDHLLILVPAAEGTADLDVMCYAGCGPEAMVLTATEEGSMKTYESFTSAPIALACPGSLSVTSSLYPQGGAKAVEETLAQMVKRQSAPVLYGHAVQNLPVMWPGLLYRLEIALSVPTSDETTFLLAPRPTHNHSAAAHHNLTTSPPNCMLAEASETGLHSLLGGLAARSASITVKAGGLGSALLLLCNHSSIETYDLTKTTGASEFPDRVLVMQLSKEALTAGDQALDLLRWHLPPSSLLNDLLSLSSEVADAACAWWMHDAQAARQRYRAIALSAVQLRAALQGASAPTSSLHQLLKASPATPRGAIDTIRAAFAHFVVDPVARSELSRLLDTFHTPQLCAPRTSPPHATAAVASPVLRGSRTPCASYVDCGSVEHCVEATQKEMAATGFAKVCEAFVLSKALRSADTSLDVNGVCAPHSWVDGYTPPGCPLTRHIVLALADDAPRDSALLQRAIAWVDRLTPRDGRSYRTTAFFVAPPAGHVTPSAGAVLSLASPADEPTPARGVLVLQLELTQPPRLAPTLLDAAINRLACSLRTAPIAGVPAKPLLRYAATAETLRCDEGLDTALSLIEALSVPSQSRVALLSGLANHSHGEFLDTLLAAEFLPGPGSHGACPERAAPFLQSTTLADSTRSLLCGAVLNRLAADLAAGETSCGGSPSAQRLAHASTLLARPSEGRRLSQHALLPPRKAAVELLAASSPEAHALHASMQTFATRCPAESAQLCSAQNFNCDGKVGDWTAECTSHGAADDDSLADPRFPDCDLADWICLSGTNTTSPDPYKVVIDLVVLGSFEEYSNRVLAQLVHEFMAVASIPAHAVSIEVTQSAPPYSRLNITIGAEDELRARKIVQSFKDSFATRTTASALLGITVSKTPLVYVLDVNGDVKLSAKAIAAGEAVVTHDEPWAGEPVKVGWILAAVFGGIALFIVIVCVRGLGAVRLRQMEPLMRDHKAMLAETHFFTVVDTRQSRGQR